MKCIILLLFALASFSPFLEAKHKPSKSPKQKICLNMIVKDESFVIKRCLDSVVSVIDYWVIVDTGSTDGTQTIIQEALRSIPGKLYERPWKNFGENRSEAFNLAKGKGDYILFMDADDLLEFEGEKKWPHLTKDLYMFWRGGKYFSYLKPQLVNGRLPWKWIGVTHEYLGCQRPYSSAILEGVKYVSGEGGARSQDPQKFWKNVDLLLEELKKEPTNVRYMFYLAESYRDAGDKQSALEWYQKRAAVGGWSEEVFWSKLQIGHLLMWTGESMSKVIESYKGAHQYRPHRMEPVYYLAKLYNEMGLYLEAYNLLTSARQIPQPKQPDLLFHETWIQRYGILFQLALSSYYIGNYEESLNFYDALLSLEDLPEEWRLLVEYNRKFSLKKNIGLK